VKCGLPNGVDNLDNLNLNIVLLDLNSPAKPNQVETVCHPESISGPTMMNASSDEDRLIFGPVIVVIQLRVRIATISRKQSLLVNMKIKNHNFSGMSVKFCSDDNGRPYYLPTKRKRCGNASEHGTTTDINLAVASSVSSPPPTPNSPSAFASSNTSEDSSSFTLSYPSHHVPSLISTLQHVYGKA